MAPRKSSRVVQHATKETSDIQPPEEMDKTSEGTIQNLRDTRIQVLNENDGSDTDSALDNGLDNDEYHEDVEHDIYDEEGQSDIEAHEMLEKCNINDDDDDCATDVQLPSLEPTKAYELVVAHREKRVNSVQILKGLERFSNGKAEMDIPLCRMRKLQVVRMALDNDIKKMQGDFVHGYRRGAAVFYVSTTNYDGKEKHVTTADRSAWSAHWRAKDLEFEIFLRNDEDLKELSDKYFYVWDGNHRLLAWYDYIKRIHRSDLDWHYRVRSIVLHTIDDITDALTAMHDINKATENSHVKTSFVHTLHRMQKVGSLPIEKFKRSLTQDEFQAVVKSMEAPLEKRPWYPIPRTKFLEYIYSQEIAEAGDEGQRRYDDETPKRKRTAEGLLAAIDGAMEAKKKAFNAPFNKYIAISNPANGKNFLTEIAKHWSTNLQAEMTTEKLQNLATSCLDAKVKEAILKIWNSSNAEKKIRKFPIGPFNDLIFSNYLRKYVFWTQLKEESLNFYETIMAGYPTSGKKPSISFAAFIDTNRIRQWDYAFDVQVQKKEISKSDEWGSPKQPHGEPAMNRLIYRYWTHVLQKEDVVPEAHPCFGSWLDLMNQKTMFMADQAKEWSSEHLFACHWYIEMDPKDTPPHEIENRRHIEPLFQRLHQANAQATPSAPIEVRPKRGRKRLATVSIETAPTNASFGRQISSTRTKRGAPPASIENEPSKKGKHDDAVFAINDVVDITESEARSSRSNSHTISSIGGGLISMLKPSLEIQDLRGRTYQELLINNSVEDFLESEIELFEEFVQKARGNITTYVHGKAGLHPCANLVIIDQPFDSIVAGFGNTIPAWNSMPTTSKDWYASRFKFADKYLHDDGGILILMPTGLNYELVDWIYKYRLKTKCEWQCHQLEPLTHPVYDDMLTQNFSVVLLLKTGRLKDAEWDRLPVPFKLNQDPLLANTSDDPLKFLSLTNHIANPTLDSSGKPWRGPHEKSDVFYQILIDMCSKPCDVVADLSASTRASLRAARASGRHFFGIEEDTEIFNAILKPMTKKTNVMKSRCRRGMDELNCLRGHIFRNPDFMRSPSPTYFLPPQVEALASMLAIQESPKRQRHKTRCHQIASVFIDEEALES